MSIDPGINEHEAYAVAEAFAAGRAMGHAEARDAVDDERRSYYADCVNDGRQPDGTTIATFRLSLAAIDALTTRGKEGNREA